MTHIVRDQGWAALDLDTGSGRVFVQERWQYQWIATGGVPAWTAAEQRTFHRALDTQIWRYWSNRVRLKTSGTNAFCRRHPTVSVNFDVRSVQSNPHWTVNVRKLPAGSTPTTYISNVDRPLRTINLDTADLSGYRPCNAAGRCRDFRAVPHEFGHSFPAVDDEYDAGDPNLPDH